MWMSSASLAGNRRQKQVYENEHILYGHTDAAYKPDYTYDALAFDFLPNTFGTVHGYDINRYSEGYYTNPPISIIVKDANITESIIFKGLNILTTNISFLSNDENDYDTLVFLYINDNVMYVNKTSVYDGTDPVSVSDPDLFFVNKDGEFVTGCPPSPP